MVKVKGRGTFNHKKSNIAMKSHQIQKGGGDSGPRAGFKKKLKKMLIQEKNNKKPKKNPPQINGNAKKSPVAKVEIEFPVNGKKKSPKNKPQQNKTPVNKPKPEANKRKSIETPVNGNTNSKKQKQENNQNQSNGKKLEKKKKSKNKNKTNNVPVTPGKYVKPLKPINNHDDELSNSEDESYLDQFFSDQEDLAQESIPDEEEYSSDEISEELTDEDDSDEEDNESIKNDIQDLITYFGNYQDKEDSNALAKIEEEPSSSGEEDDEEELDSDEDWSDPSFRVDQASDSDILEGEFEDYYDLDDEFGSDFSGITESDEYTTEYSSDDGQPSLGEWLYDENLDSGSDSEYSGIVSRQAKLTIPKEGQFKNLPEDGPAIAEIENDSDECPELVPIPKELKTKTKANKKSKTTQEEQTEMFDSDAATFYISHDFEHVLVHLKKPVYYYGNLKIRLVAGKVTILGYELKDSTKEIDAFSTEGTIPIEITPIDSGDISIAESFVKEIRGLFNHQDLLELKKYYDPTHAVLLLRGENEKYSNFIKNNSDDPSKTKKYSQTYESILRTKFITNPQQKLSDIYSNNIIELEKNSRILTVGGKNTGKTTLNRHLVNSNLKQFNKILYIDLDIGQPEFGLPQTVSAHVLDQPIIGNGFLSLTKKDPEYSVLFGDLNVAVQPIRYFECVKKLIKYVQDNKEWRNIPWIVNTMGYAKGLGTELIVAILYLLKPTNVIQLNNKKQKLENFGISLTPSNVQNFHFELLSNEEVHEKDINFEYLKIDGVPKDEKFLMKGNDTRTMNILSNLGSCLVSESTLNEIVPICAPLNELKIINFNEVIPRDLLPKLINGNMVYLCDVSEDEKHPICYGLGIVRGVDKDQQKVFLISGIKRSRLKLINALVLTSIPVPPQIILNQGTDIEGDVPYVCKTDSNSILFRNVIDRPFRSDKVMQNTLNKL